METDSTPSSNTTASISSWSWRHRFYAFLLRRALGPLLSTKSREQLQQSISNVDWSTGELQLVNVELDPSYLTNVLQGNSASEGDDTDDTSETEQKNNIAVHYACIRKFAVQISVCDIESTASNSSTARKATSVFLQGMFGSNDTTNDSGSSSGVALKVHVQLKGIDIVLAPTQPATKMEWSTTYKQPSTVNKSSDDINEQSDTSAQQQPGFFSSLVDSAMKSLRLSVDVSDLKVSVYSKYHNNNNVTGSGSSVNYENEETTFVTLSIASARYYDLIESKQVSSDNRRLDKDSHKPIEDEVSTREKIVISKAFDWEGITIQTSTSSVQEKSISTPSTNTPCLQSSGMGKLRFRIYEKWSSNNTFTSARQGIEVSLGEQLSIELDVSSLTHIIDIVNAITKPLGDDDGHFVDAYEDDMENKTLEESSTVLKQEESDHPDQHLLTDEFSRETYDAIMKQYTEARHLARTQELRGGLLIPSFNGENGDIHNDTDDISFDAFFDANDHSLSYYNSMLDENSMQHSDEDIKLNSEKKHNRSIQQTKLEVGLAEFTVKVNVGTSSSTEEEAQQSEYILLSMGDLRVLAFRSNEESKLNCNLSHFDVESQVFDCQKHTLVNAPMLRFLDESEGGFGNGLLLSSPPCISLMAEFDRKDENRKCSVRLDIALQPLEITHQETAFQRLSDAIAKLPQSETPISSKEEEDNDDRAATSRDVNLAVSCSSAVLLFPCQQVPKKLFHRHGYKDQASGGNTFVGIGVEVDNITLDISHKSHHNGDDGTTSDESTTVTCTKSILFVKGIELEQGRRRNRKAIISQRADLVALVGDVDSETPISISFSKFAKSSSHDTNSVFPIILPLSSTKARQYEDESDEDDIDNVHAVEEATPIGMQTSDPQFILSSEANEAESELVVNLPNILLDFTTLEKEALFNLLSSLTSENKESSDNDHGNETKGNTVRIGVNVGQLSVVLHPSQPNESNSYSIIMDRLRMHALFRNSGLRNIRVLSHDVTLYELSNFCQPLKGTDCPISCSERCKKIQARLTKNSSQCRVILCRQKLCKPMTLDTPSLQIDVLIRRDDNCAESSIYMNVYDMSYRYIINSEWIQNLIALIKGVDKPETDSNTEQPASLMNLFVTITDCQMDYTPPITLRTASRVIVRLGELRFSSNIVTPAATVQAYKLALADMNVHICNYRHSYNEENALLSCAHRLLNDDDIFIPEKVKCLSRNVVGIDDALCRMGFVNIVALDTLDAIIFKSNTHDRNDCRKKNDPAVSVSLTLGRLAMNACHDSFSCLNSTYNEWFIKTTTLSEEELNELKELSDAQSELKIIAPPTKQSSEEITTEVANQSMNTKVASTSTENQDRDDKVSLDLTKSLLFQNYYTFDAKTNRHATIQVQESEDIIKQSEDDLSVSSDDEWNTIEHDFIQHSTIPREQDFAAEWIVCDEANVPTSDAFQSTLSQTVKVYPQHIPVKPVLDPFNGGDKVDTAKLAGTSDAPEIGLRLIVKDGSIQFRFFDGYDWISDAPQFHQKKPKPKDCKEALLSGLIGGGDDSESGSNTRLDIAPLPEERNRNLQRDIVRRRLKRNPDKYFQLSFDGVKLKNDSFAQSKHHLLASRLDLSVTDFMVVETISSSSGDHVKMMGEWFNESIHPRDDSDGIIMLQMTTKHPKQRVSSDGKLMSDESRATLELLPLRCYFNQNALRFVRNFFSGNHPVESDEEGDNDTQDNSDDTEIEDDEIVQIFFESFSVRPVRLKVDYQPENMDIDSFKEGNYIELLNICPLEEMVLNLQPVLIKDLTGWGSVFGELASKWIEDICNTQSHKFFTRASPFQPFSNLSDPLLDLAMVLVVPEGSTSAYLKSIIGGTTHLASKVVLEALSTSAKLTKFAAKAIPSKVKGSLPRRPKTVPRHAGDSMSHAYDSVTSGLREANYKIVTIPLKEYQRSGASGAATAAVKGIPIGIIAPLAGASEALSYTLLGLRNQLQPDVRREEEASLRGLPPY